MHDFKTTFLYFLLAASFESFALATGSLVYFGIKFYRKNPRHIHSELKIRDE